MSLIQVTDLVKVYPGDVRAVDEVGFEVERGEIFGFLGPNGAGKTTTFYMVVGAVRPDGGKIWLDGVDITRRPMHVRARLGIGYLPQEASIFRDLSVWDNVMAILEFMPLSRHQRRERATQLLAELSLMHVRDSAGRALSGGERRRAEIARTLAGDPKFILLDEPFAGVDPIAVGEIQRIVRYLRDKGLGILITDHNVRETLSICDHTYVMNDGRILVEGKAADIVANKQARESYLGEDFELPASRAAEAAAAETLEVSALAPAEEAPEEAELSPKPAPREAPTQSFAAPARSEAEEVFGEGPAPAPQPAPAEAAPVEEELQDLPRPGAVWPPPPGEPVLRGRGGSQDEPEPPGGARVFGEPEREKSRKLETERAVAGLSWPLPPGSSGRGRG